MQPPLWRPWVTDPLVIDCSFQMMILWGSDQYQAASLHCYVGAYRQYQRAFPKGDVRSLAHVKQSSQKRAVGDIDFVDGGGRLVAGMDDYACVIDASLNELSRDRMSCCGRTWDSERCLGL